MHKETFGKGLDGLGKDQQEGRSPKQEARVDLYRLHAFRFAVFKVHMVLILINVVMLTSPTTQGPMFSVLF
jgi:hypothetical protein